MKLRYKILGGLVGFLAIATMTLALLLGDTDACPSGPAFSGDGETMTSVIYRCYGPPEVLEYTSVAKPQPTGNEVLVQVHNASVNPLDWHYMRGSPYIMRIMAGLGAPQDHSMGVDFAGTVVEVGSEVTHFKPGDRVFGGRSGAFSEYVLVPENRAIVAMPHDVSFEQAAAVPIAAITALQALRDHGQLQAGQKVLINGASGGVGSYAVQIAVAMGAEVSGVCSGRNVDMVRSLGADRVFNYKEEDYTQSGQEFDLIVDMIGNHSALENRKVLTPTGRLVIVGGEKGDWIGPLLTPIKAALVNPFVDQELTSFTASMTQQDLEVLANMMADGQLRSVIDQRYPLKDIREAMAYSESGRARGKIIIEVSEPTGM